MRGVAGAVLYTRRACPLCFALARLADRSSRRHRVGLVEADVDADPELLERYGSRVPVLELPGGMSMSGRVSARDVDEAFRRAAVFLLGLEARADSAGPGAEGMRRRPRILWLRRVLGLGAGRSKDRTA